MGKRKKKEEQEQVEEEQALSLANVPGDLLPEILSRVPYRSLCRFKCVSRAWLALCSDPAVRKRSPQTLSGFFCKSRGRGIRFLNLSGRGRPLVDPSLRFLRGYERVVLLDCCGGILLCRGWNLTMKRRVYVVFNPMTQEMWAALPVPDTQSNPFGHEDYYITCLCLHPVVPGRFAVFVLFRGQRNIAKVEVYSSDTRKWTSMACGWGPRINMPDAEPGHIFFLNDTLHFIAYYSGQDAADFQGLVVTVDMDGSTWRTIQMPPKVWFSFIGQSQGHLYGMQGLQLDGDCRISVWVLKDYASGQWILKHTASVLELLGRPCRKPDEFYWFVAIHPERNLLFLHDGVQQEETLMSYDMDNKKLNVICTLEEYDTVTFRPYTPCFAERPSAAL